MNIVVAPRSSAGTVVGSFSLKLSGPLALSVVGQPSPVAQKLEKSGPAPDGQMPALRLHETLRFWRAQRCQPQVGRLGGDQLRFSHPLPVNRLVKGPVKTTWGAPGCAPLPKVAVGHGLPLTNLKKPSSTRLALKLLLIRWPGPAGDRQI